MIDLTFHVEDDRQPAPVIRHARVRDERDGTTLAHRMLRETYHHLSVEVWLRGRRVLVLKSEDVAVAAPAPYATQAPAPPSSLTA